MLPSLKVICTIFLTLQSHRSRDERKIVAQLWKTIIWGAFCQKIVLWCSLSENCGRGWGCGGKYLKIVVVVGVGVLVFGKIVLLLWLWCSLFKKFGCGWVVVAFS